MLAVDYEHAPESRFPAQIEQIYAAALWAQEQNGQLDCDTGRLAIAGDSSGANLAAAVALLARERGRLQFQHQLLLVPLLDTLFDSASWRELGQDYLLSVEQLTWALRNYAPGVDRRHPLLSPLHAEDLSALPPTTIIVGEFDPFATTGLLTRDGSKQTGLRSRRSMSRACCTTRWSYPRRCPKDASRWRRRQTPWPTAGDLGRQWPVVWRTGCGTGRSTAIAAPVARRAGARQSYEFDRFRERPEAPWRRS